MNLLIGYIVLLVLSFLVMIILLIIAPIGYEDGGGFHKLKNKEDKNDI